MREFPSFFCFLKNVYENWHWFNVTFHEIVTKLKEELFYETKIQTLISIKYLHFNDSLQGTSRKLKWKVFHTQKSTSTKIKL